MTEVLAAAEGVASKRGAAGGGGTTRCNNTQTTAGTRLHIATTQHTTTTQHHTTPAHLCRRVQQVARRVRPRHARRAVLAARQRRRARGRAARDVENVDLVVVSRDRQEVVRPVEAQRVERRAERLVAAAEVEAAHGFVVEAHRFLVGGGVLGCC